MIDGSDMKMTQDYRYRKFRGSSIANGKLSYDRNMTEPSTDQVLEQFASNATRANDQDGAMTNPITRLSTKKCLEMMVTRWGR